MLDVVSLLVFEKPIGSNDTYRVNGNASKHNL